MKIEMRLITSVIVLLLVSSLHAYDYENKCGIMTVKGKIITKPTYTGYDSGARNFEEKHIKVGKDNYWGIVGFDGKLVGKIEYENVSIFGRPMFEVQKNEKVGFLNRKGEESIPCIYDYFIISHEEMNWYVMAKDDKCIIVDSMNNMIFPPVDYFEFNQKKNSSYKAHNIALINDGKYALANRKGEILTPFVYDEMELFEKGGAVVSQGGSCYKFISSEGVEVDSIINKSYGAKEDFICDKGSLIVVNVGNKSCKLYSPEGKKLKEYIGYISDIGFSEGMWSMKLNKGWTAIDSLGNIIFDKYFEVPRTSSFGSAQSGLQYRDGAARVAKGSMRGVIDKKGEFIVPLDYVALEWVYPSNNALLIGKREQDEKFTIINIKAGTKIPLKYDSVTDLYEKYIGVWSKESEGYGVVSTIDGEEVLPCAYDKLMYTKGNLIMYEKDKKIGFFNPLTKEDTGLSFDDWQYPHNKAQLVIVEKDNLYGVVNAEGKLIVPCEYVRIQVAQNDGYIVTINKDRKSSVMDENGEIVLGNSKYLLEYMYNDLLLFLEIN